MADLQSAESPGTSEHAVTPLELFFDLVFVFAVTQVTSFLTHDPTWAGLLRGLLVLSAVWWAWGGYTWLGSTLDVDEGGVRLALLVAMAGMLGMGLAVPHAFDRYAVFFGSAYLLVRAMHLTLYAVVSRHDRNLLRAVARVLPPTMVGTGLILGAAFVEGHVRLVFWVVALAVEFGGPPLLGLEGWRIAPQHFAERFGLVVLIALGESLIAIGAGVGSELTIGVVGAAALGFVVVAAMWWLYFDVAALFGRRRLMQLHGVEQIRLALTSYAYLHLAMVAGVVLFAFGLKTTLHDVGHDLGAVNAAALCGGAALYLVAQVIFLWRATGRVFRRRTLAALVLLLLGWVATTLPAVASVGSVAGVCVLLVAYEAIGRRDSRAHLRAADHQLDELARVHVALDGG